MSEKFYHEITDKQWEIIAPHLPKQKSTGRIHVPFSMQFIGNWNSIYHKFRSRIEEGVFEKILQSLI